MSLFGTRARRASALLVGVVAALPLVLAAPASAHDSHGDNRGHHQDVRDYLALGDSVAFGFQPKEVNPNYNDPTSFVGYGEDLAKKLHLNITNASCPGETTTSLITGAGSNGCEDSATSPFGYRDVFPLHTSYSGTQLAFAVDYLSHHRHTKLVTIDIGANDVFLCQAATTDGCASELPATLQHIGQNLATILAALRQTGYHHKLVVLAYYSLNYNDPFQVAGTQALNATLAAVAAQFQGIVADGFTAFKVASGSGGDPCAAGLLIPLPNTTTCNIHPSALGHQVLAAAIRAALDDD